MAPVTHRLRVDQTRGLVDQPTTGHNRWHPAIPPLLRIRPGDTIDIDMRDGLDNQIWPESGIDDVMRLDVRRGHPLTGPFYVEGAEPGDLLDVEIMDIEAAAFGFTMVIPGLGLLATRFSEPFLAKWDLVDSYATSAQIPGVRIKGAPFLGVLGVAPSTQRLEAFALREADLSRRGGFVLPPDPERAVPRDDEIGLHGLRTAPPREHGGNMDARQLTAGSRIQLPVEVPGGLFSAGDAHFAQGDGESCGVAIEMSARAELRIGLIKANDAHWHPTNPVYWFRDGPPRGYIATTGVSVDDDGVNHFLDATVAARNALNEMVDHLMADRGYSAEQAYLIVSVAADLRISSIVNVPNAMVSAMLPLDIFDV